MKGKKTGGRRPGSLNKSTVEFRKTVQDLLDENRDNVARWLTLVAEEDPSKALSHIAALAEFAAPKLARTELTGKDGGAVEASVTLTVAGIPAPKRGS